MVLSRGYSRGEENILFSKSKEEVKEMDKKKDKDVQRRHRGKVVSAVVSEAEFKEAWALAETMHLSLSNLIRLKLFSASGISK